MLLPSLGNMVVPADQQERLFRALGAADVTLVAAALLGGLLVIDAALIVLALARFQRSRLVTD